MRKPMLAAEQPPETETETASDQEAAALASAPSLQDSIMAAAWQARGGGVVGGDPTATAAPLAVDDDGRMPVTTRLKPSVHDYLVQRARMHGETPEQHLDTILRAFRLTDPHRPDLARLPPAEPGLPAMARPR